MLMFSLTAFQLCGQNISILTFPCKRSWLLYVYQIWTATAFDPLTLPGNDFPKVVLWYSFHSSLHGLFNAEAQFQSWELRQGLTKVYKHLKTHSDRGLASKIICGGRSIAKVSIVFFFEYRNELVQYIKVYESGYIPQINPPNRN